MAQSGSPSISGQLACPHTVVILWSKADLPAQADQDSCPVCAVDWFATVNGRIAVPIIISHCGHVVCRTCFSTQRATTLACVFPPRWCPGNAPLNLDHCGECRDWVARGFATPGPTKRVLTVCDSLLEIIIDELTDLRKDSRFFHIPAAQKKSLVKYWCGYLYDFGGQYHRCNDLAEMLDPFRGAEIDHNEVIQIYGTSNVLAPMPDPSRHGYLLQNPALAAEFPNGVEPWISTVLRSVFKKMSDEEGEDVEEKEHGIFLLRHELHAEAYLDDNGEWMDDWPVKQVLGHRFDQDGEIEYEVQYLGFTHHVQNDWRRPEEFRLDTIWKKYNHLHGLPIPDEDEE